LEPGQAGTNSTGNHWTATEYSDTNARNINFTDGNVNNNNKTNANSVRCVRGKRFESIFLPTFPFTEL
jgi:hypothetical protein